ncbi:MAG: TrmB family transcriptional regulator [Promethearchaeota archaeon]
MSVMNPYLAFNFSDAEESLYKLLLQISKLPRPDSKSSYNKIKATDLIEISKYSKPKVYEIIRRLEEKGLIYIDNTRPMFLRPIEPEIAIRNLLLKKEKRLEKAATLIINELNLLPNLKINFPFSEVPLYNFISKAEDYYKTLKYMLEKTKKEIILIIGYLISIEEDLLKEYLEIKLKEGKKVLVLYGGSPKFKIYFKNKIINPINSFIKKKEDFIETYFTPPIRITIIDDKELLMALARYDEGIKRLNVKRISGIHSENRNLIDYARDTFYMLRPTADAKLIEKFLQMKGK